MIINETKMFVRAVQLSGYEINTLTDARKTLNLLFNRLTSKDNMTRCFNIISELDNLLDELEENNNSLLEFKEDK